ncbi:hypothetical protein [Sorangium sp. So ce861]|uniref:hypothetical protein n=1 Tax=Sorangium sp. So ce861 TaxID=3133323 RepID=UPI003F640CCA
MKKITIVALVAAALSVSHSALATHKAWLMKDGGAECTFAYPEATDRLDSSGAIYNSSTSARDVICPVALSGRWGSNGATAFDAKRWADALSAVVYFDRRGAGTRTVSCYAAMRASDNSVYYSASVSDTGGSGVDRLDLAGSTSGAGPWAGGTGNGNTLEAHEDTVVKGLEFVCVVPGQTAILGYKAKLCQLTGDCTNGGGDPEDESAIATTGNYVQTSGIECSAAGTEGTVASVYRNGYGATNLGSSPVDIFCPIAPPSDDSREHNRSVTDTTVYYSDLYNTSGSNLNSCVGGATCPSCRLMWYDRDGVMQDTGALSKVAGVRKLRQGVSSELIGKELQFGVMCRTPPGLTIEGITSLVTVSEISGGM